MMTLQNNQLDADFKTQYSKEEQQKIVFTNEPSIIKLKTVDSSPDPGVLNEKYAYRDKSDTYLRFKSPTTTYESHCSLNSLESGKSWMSGNINLNHEFSLNDPFKKKYEEALSINQPNSRSSSQSTDFMNDYYGSKRRKRADPQNDRIISYDDFPEEIEDDRCIKSEYSFKEKYHRIKKQIDLYAILNTALPSFKTKDMFRRKFSLYASNKLDVRQIDRLITEQLYEMQQSLMIFENHVRMMDLNNISQEELIYFSQLFFINDSSGRTGQIQQILEIASLVRRKRFEIYEGLRVLEKW